MNDAIDITSAQRQTILALFKRYLPDVTVWAYGSRVKGISRPVSDLDLVVFSQPEHAGQISLLKEAMDESSLPFRVDLFVWDEVPENFRRNIEQEHLALIETEGSGKGVRD